MSRDPSGIERRLARVFVDGEPTAFGSGGMRGRILVSFSGIHGDPVPEGYARQFAYPFVKRDAG